MITAWRIVKSRWAATAFDGKSASIAGGRWNSRGTAVVYSASTASLAALELLVHLTSESDLSDFVLFACHFDERMVTQLDRAALPSDWRAAPAPAALKHLGDAWAKAGKSLALQVPSVIIDTEWNYILNPAHEDFASIEILEPVPFSLDMRLIKR